jgi:hypothetical protein
MVFCILSLQLWKAEYYEEGCDSIIAVHRILCSKRISIVSLNIDGC